MKKSNLSQRENFIHDQYREWILSWGFFPAFVLLLFIATHFTSHHRNYLNRFLIKRFLNPKLGLLLIPITSMIYIHTINTQTLVFESQKLWPFANMSLPDFFHRLPGIHQPIYWRLPGHMIWYPAFWMLSIWFWKGLQRRKPCLEAWFRIFLIPISFVFLSVWGCFFFLDFEKLWHLFCIVLAAMGAFAILNQSYLGGIMIYATHLFQEGDIISIPNEGISQGEVISIGFIRTRIKMPETTRIRLIPNKRFLSISIEKTSP